MQGVFLGGRRQWPQAFGIRRPPEGASGVRGTSSGPRLFCRISSQVFLVIRYYQGVRPGRQAVQLLGARGLENRAHAGDPSKFSPPARVPTARRETWVLEESLAVKFAAKIGFGAARGDIFWAKICSTLHCFKRMLEIYPYLPSPIPHLSAAAISHRSSPVSHLPYLIFHLASPIPTISSVMSHLTFLISSLLLMPSLISHVASRTPHLASLISHLASLIPHLSSLISHLSSLISHLSFRIPHSSSLISRLSSLISHHLSSLISHLSLISYISPLISHRS